MNEPDLDRIIDSATADMIGREPGHTLRHTVMARVRAPEPKAPRRFIWATAGLAAAALVVGALVMTEKTPTPLVQSTPPARPTIVEQPAAAINQATPAPAPASQAALPVAGRRAPRRIPTDDPSTIEALATEQIVLPSIDLPAIENQAAFVEGLEIEALTIEPLTASND